MSSRKMPDLTAGFMTTPLPPVRPAVSNTRPVHPSDYREGKEPRTVWVNPEAWEQLRNLSKTERDPVDGKRMSIERLVLEGLNAVFQKRGLPTF